MPQDSWAKCPTICYVRPLGTINQTLAPSCACTELHYVAEQPIVVAQLVCCPRRRNATGRRDISRPISSSPLRRLTVSSRKDWDCLKWCSLLWLSIGLWRQCLKENLTSGCGALSPTDDCTVTLSSCFRVILRATYSHPVHMRRPSAGSNRPPMPRFSPPQTEGRSPQ